jgi:hypothetical protein
MPPRPSNKDPRRGFTIMILGGPGEQPRRLHVPRWALRALACSWLMVMLVAAWCGFYGSDRPKAGAVPARLHGSVAASTLVSGSSPAARHE